MTSETDSLSANQITALSARAVEDYLREHPDFFHGRDELVKSLTIPHDSGNAISLLEHQVTLLREDNREQSRQIDSLVQNAGSNDTLFEKTRMVVLALLKADSLTRLDQILAEEMRLQFSTEWCGLVFISETPQRFEGLETRSHDAAVTALGELFARKRTFCGRLDERQSTFFFGNIAAGIASAAIVPIHLSRPSGNDENLLPILVLGSDNADYFHSSQDTLFLDFIGEVLATLIDRLPN